MIGKLKLLPFIIDMVLCVINVLLHSLGIMLLCSTGRQKTLQQVNLTSLSFAELVISLVFLIKLSLYTSSRSYDDYNSTISIAMHTIFVFVYLMTKLYLLMDQLLLNTRFRERHMDFWDRRRAGFLLNGTWFSGLLLCLGIVFGTDWHKEKYSHEFHHVMFYADITIIVFSIIFLSYIFYNINKKVHDGGDNEPLPVFFVSSIKIVIMVIVSIILFNLLGDILMFVDCIHDDDAIVFNLLAYTTDGFSYIILDGMLRQMLLEKVWKFWELFQTTRLRFRRSVIHPSNIN